MNPSLKHIVLFLFLFVGNFCFSQNNTDTVLMLNGNSILTTVIESTDLYTRCRHPKKIQKTILVENDRIFSIKNANGEKLIYSYDTLIGNDLTIEEMRYYIIGEQDAQRGYKPRGVLVASILIGAASGLTGSFLSPIPPFAYTALLAIPKIRVKKKSVSNPELLKQQTYLMGYERVARKKRNVQSLIGGGAGLVVGLTSFSILKNNGIDPLE